ncbi:hypothetical protein HUK65_15750 [Rhodobacteraceae bacterium 2376]|uniref:Sulfotransferase family protein n=1 Tax=Rhabdonatronobacter sediminivivens TaxID=2743469 RepID=A0A7Z0I1Y1_9RHOB|nr:hypothetical protein [Rhabdonatronobacter sediminivivens]NYS26441.1 hypothetical protein [Rhabdonatronobacter sediminivivens]
MSLVIHIGLRKTGTTYLQQVLAQNRGPLAERGLLYPDPASGLAAGSGPAHHFLAHALRNWRVKYTPADPFDRLEAHVAALRAELADHAGTGVLSSEDFSRLNGKQITALRTLFPERDVRILVYLRRQDQWLDALYGQVLKVGRQVEMDSFIARNRARLDYAALLDPWAQAFGAENLIVRPYEGFEEGGLWEDFCTALDCPAAAALPLTDAQVNVSLSYEAGMFLASVSDGARRQRLRQLLEEGEAATPRRPVLKYLKAEQARTLLADHADSNAEIARRYLGRDRLFADTRPLPQYRRRPAVLRHAVVAGHLLRGLLATRRGRRMRPDDSSHNGG